MAELTGINTYPIKSCEGTGLDVARVTERGIEFDHEWMVTDADGVFRSQRDNPAMAMISPEITDEGLMVVRAPGMEELEVPLTEPTDASYMDTTVWENDVSAHRIGDNADDWFSRYLGEDSHFVRFGSDSQRAIKDRYKTPDASEQVSLADAFPMLFTTEQSLEDLNANLDDPIGMDRMRANTVVDGEEFDPYDEDYWRKIAIGDMTAYVVRACARCPIPDTDQSTGERGRTVRKALRLTRNGFDLTKDSNPPGVFFGQNILHEFEEGTVLRVGDPVAVEERSSNRSITLR